MKLSILYLFQFLAAGIAASIAILIPFIAFDLDLSLSQVGFVSSLSYLSRIILVVPVVFIANRYSNKLLVYVSMIVITLSFAFTGFATTYFAVIAAILAVSFGIGMYQPLVKAEIARSGNTKNTGAKIGNLSTVGQLGKLVLNTTLGYTILLIGWRFASIAYGLIPFFIVAMIIYLNRAEKYDDIDLESSQDIRWRTHLTPRLIYVLIADFLDCIASSSVLVFLPFLITFRNFDVVYLPTASAVMLVGTVVGKFILGKLTDKYEPGKVYIFSQLIMALLTILIAFTSNIALLLVGAFLLGMMTKGTAPVLQIMVGRAVTNRSFLKRAFYLDDTVGNIGALLSTIVFGFIGERFGVNIVFAGFTVLALISIIPAIGYIRTDVDELSAAENASV